MVESLCIIFFKLVVFPKEALPCNYNASPFILQVQQHDFVVERFDLNREPFICILQLPLENIL